MRAVVKKYLAANGLPLLLSLPLGLLALPLMRYAIELPLRLAEFMRAQGPALRGAFNLEGIVDLGRTLAVAAGVGTAVCLAGFLVGLIRKPWALRVVRAAYWVCFALAAIYLFAVLRVTDLIFAKDLKIDGVTPDQIVVFYWRWDWLWPVGLAVLGVAWLYLTSWRRMAIDLYSGYREVIPAPGDRIVENLRSHGTDPRFRKSLISSFALHLLVIVIIPNLLLSHGCVEDYLVPQGSGTAAGNPVVTLVRAKPPQKKKKQQHFVLNDKSAISFIIPDLDRDSRVEKDVDKATEVTYMADTTAVFSGNVGKKGKLGAGGGDQGGWPDGSKKARIRFIRLEYNGEEWNDGMDNVSRADMNFLMEFKKEFPQFNVATSGESQPIRSLDDYTKGYAPPFVYMTGAGRIDVSPRDVQALRRYLLEGGLLFADCASPTWDRNFRAFIRTVLPGDPLMVVSDDDPIYQQPFVFPNGAPPLWHHGGSKALGIKRGNRWVVYYFPGDMNDAWKTGHSGMKPQLAKEAYHLGFNIMYHAITHYLENTRKYRK